MGPIEKPADKPADKKDTRIAYGASCLWWGSIYEAGSTATHPRHREHNAAQKKAVPRLTALIDHGLPCCPGCGGMLMEVPDEETWLASVQRFEDDGHPGYRAMILWNRGKCFLNIDALIEAYRKDGGFYAKGPGVLA